MTKIESIAFAAEIRGTSNVSNFYRNFPKTSRWIPLETPVPQKLIDAIDLLQQEECSNLANKVRSYDLTLDEVVETIWKCLQPGTGLGDRKKLRQAAREWYSNPKNRKALRITLRKALSVLKRAAVGVQFDGLEEPQPTLEGKSLTRIHDRFHRVIHDIPFLIKYLDQEPKFTTPPRVGTKEVLPVNLAMAELRDLFCRRRKRSQTEGAQIIVELLSCFGIEKDLSNVVRILEKYPIQKTPRL